MFPFGQFVYEPLHALLKGVMIIGVLLSAFVSNASRIFYFINGKETTILNMEVILIYTLLMTLLCFGSAIYYKRQNNKINNSSIILRAEHSSATIDGFMSASIGIALVGISFINPEGSLGFLNYIGDAILVLVLCVLLGKQPFVLVRDSFIEIAGGTLQNQREEKHIKEILNEHFSSDNTSIDSYISKTGSSYLVVVYISTQSIEELGLNKMMQIKRSIINDLKESYPDVMFEIVLT